MSLTQRTVDCAITTGADLAAAAPVTERVQPPGAYSPEELVPGARGELVLGLKMVITREYGPRARFVCVVTDAPLERIRPRVVERSGEICGGCTTCLDSCPVGALRFDEEAGEPRVDRALCSAYMYYCQCALGQAICPLGSPRVRAEVRRQEGEKARKQGNEKTLASLALSFTRSLGRLRQQGG